MKKMLFLAGALLLGGNWYFQRGGLGVKLPTTPLPETELVQTISEGGADVTLADHLDAAKWTLFEYGADW